MADPYGAEAGAKVLEQGGNAIDAAVAIAYALNVVEPQSAGVGGGGCMMIHLAKAGETFSIDTRERAPALATRDMFVNVPNASLHGVAVGVPGMVRGTAMAVERCGSLSLAKVLAPAIALADEGFAATARCVSSTNRASATSRAKNSPEAADDFCPGGASLAVGALVKNPPLAETFRKIAGHGPDCFYTLMPEEGCDIAMGIVEGQEFNRPQASVGKGGSMTHADLEHHHVSTRLPVEGNDTYLGIRGAAIVPGTRITPNLVASDPRPFEVVDDHRRRAARAGIHPVQDCRLRRSVASGSSRQSGSLFDGAHLRTRSLRHCTAIRQPA